MTSKHKIYLGTIIIVFFLIIYSFLSFIIVYTAFVGVEGEVSRLEQILNLIFTMGILYFPFQYGIKLRKSGKSELITPIEGFDERVTLRFDSQITLKDYKMLVIELSFQSPITIHLTIMGLIFLSSIFLNAEGNWQLALVGSLFLSIPFLRFLGASKVFKSNKNLNEAISYEINIDNVILKGETFNSILSWSGFYKVKEVKNWFLLYTSKNTMIPVNKKQLLVNPENEELLRGIIFNRPQLIKELKGQLLFSGS